VATVAPVQTVVLVTAGAAGVGRVIAETFIGDGATVHVCDTSENHIKAFLSDNPTATATLCDVADADQVEHVFDALNKTCGGLHILINNAGIAGPTAMTEDISVDEWNRCMEVNLNSVFYFTRRAIPILKRQHGGVIVNIASNAGLFGCPNRSPYAASKWAMIGLTKTWAMELGPHNIRVNAICPTSVEGARIENVIEQDAARRGLTSREIRDVYQRQSSMRTFVTAEDVANMVVFLASDKAARISGQAIAVDGHTETLANWLDFE
jgi:NAD(P)-dependent dehydrogenase (short-subunit alcohol dehydrogenase family)